MKQVNLFGKTKWQEQQSPEADETRQEFNEARKEARKNDIEYCKGVVRSDPCLWDMRCWKNHKDEAEIDAWMRRGFWPNNSGHAVCCIKRLFRCGVEKGDIVRLMLANPHVQFPNRLVPCFENGMLCPKFRKQGHYGDGLCDDCNGGRQRKKER